MGSGDAEEVDLGGVVVDLQLMAAERRRRRTRMAVVDCVATAHE
jgi:hypothetical protein